MAEDHLVVVAVDGLRASALGAYGNTSFPTPALDRLAAESLVVDWCFAGATDLSLVYRELWQSAHPLRPHGRDATRPALPQLLSERGYATTLITDDNELLSWNTAGLFDRRVEAAQPATTRAEDIAQTSLARVFAAASDVIGETAGSKSTAAKGCPQLVWVHARGGYGPWDAPLGLQAMLLDEEDPPAYEAVDPPDFSLADSDDPDAAFVAGCAYSAQMMVLDACLDGLMSAIHDTWPDDRWSLLLIGVRGFPLGEHRQVGGVDQRALVEQMHVPCLVRLSDGSARLARSGQLVSHADLLPTLWNRVSGDPLIPQAGSLDGRSLLPTLSDLSASWRDALLSVGTNGGHSLRTADWCLRRKSAAEQASKESTSSDGPRGHALADHELYVRPDDRCEANDVAGLCPDVVEQLVAFMDERADEMSADQSQRA